MNYLLFNFFNISKSWKMQILYSQCSLVGCCRPSAILGFNLYSKLFDRWIWYILITFQATLSWGKKVRRQIEKRLTYFDHGTTNVYYEDICEDFVSIITRTRQGMHCYLAEDYTQIEMERTVRIVRQFFLSRKTSFLHPLRR